ncbi:MAG TPA: MFS transporter [Plasticicumulans sp.]|nr:MFS transporter [Plasticicumulans sp.]
MTEAHAAPGLSRLRWRMYALLVGAYVLVYFHRMAPGVVAGELQQAFEASAAALGGLAAAYFYIYAAMQLPAGVLADTWGTRRTVVAGSIVAALGAVLFASAGSLAQATLGRLAIGAGVSVVFVGLMKFNAVWFEGRHYGKVAGLTLLIGNLGSIAAAGPLAGLLALVGWREVFTAIGGLSLVLAALTWQFVRDRPEEAGLAPLHVLPPAAARPHWSKELAAVLRERRLWPVVLVQFGMIGGFYAFVGLWAVPLLERAHGLARPAAAAHVTTALAVFALGSLTLGGLSDRLGRRKPVLVGAVGLYLLACLALAAAPWTPGGGGHALFAALGLGAAGLTITFPLGRELGPPALAGMAISVVNSGAFLGTALMQPLFGALVDRSGGFAAGLWLLAAGAGLALAAALACTETRCRNLAAAR